MALTPHSWERPHAWPRAPASVLGPTGQCCTPDLAHSPSEVLWGLGRCLLRLLLGCGLRVGALWVPCRAGDDGSPPLPHHPLTICLRKPCPSSAATRAYGGGGLGSRLGRCCQPGAGSAVGSARFLPSRPPKPQAPSPAAGGAASLPAPSHVKGQSEASRGEADAGAESSPKQSNVGASWEAGVWNGDGILASSFSLRFTEHTFYARPRAKCL